MQWQETGIANTSIIPYFLYVYKTMATILRNCVPEEGPSPVYTMALCIRKDAM